MSKVDIARADTACISCTNPIQGKVPYLLWKLEMKLWFMFKLRTYPTTVPAVHSVPCSEAAPLGPAPSVGTSK